MLARADFLSLNFVKKEDYTGSYQGMRYMLHQAEVEEASDLSVAGTILLRCNARGTEDLRNVSFQ